MRMEKTSGFQELAHTADWELHVWAPDLPRLLEQAARGMYALAGVELQPAPRVERRLALQTADAESLLVAFLSELLYLQESEGLAFDHFGLQITELALEARLQGAPHRALEKEIKAVTWHHLAIQPTEQGLAVNIVFDV
jgi:SHS2 domain-containing protein